MRLPHLLISALSIAVAWSSGTRAEALWPAPSPRATVSQVAGLTRITVGYHSTATPAGAGQGTAVAPGRLWLIGDQGAPTIAFSKEVDLAGAVVPAGVYSLLAVPSAKTWTLILNRRSPIWRAADRDPALDVARLEVRAEVAPRRARLAFVISDFSERRANLDLQWDAVKVRIPIDLRTEQQVDSAIHALDDTWRQYADVARFMLEKRRDVGAGLRYVDRSIALRETWTNTWIKASLLAARGERAQAASYAERALQLGRTTPGPFPNEREVREALTAWTAPPDDPPHPKHGDGAIARARLETLVVPSETTLAAATPLDRPAERKVDLPRPLPDKPPAAALFAPIVSRGLPELRRCYQRALRQDPSLSLARLTLSIAVGTSGGVAGVSVTPALPPGPLDACLKTTIARWAFPPSPQAYETLVPLVLRGRD